MGTILKFLHYARRRKRSPEDYFLFQRYQGGLIRDSIQRHRNLNKPLLVLDIGSGIGGYVYELAKTTPAHFVSLDKNPLPVAIKRYQEFSAIRGKNISLHLIKQAKIVYNSSRIAVVEGDITDAPFKDKSFDIIIASGVIEHVPGQRKMIQECHRILKDDGLFYLSFPPYYSPVGGHSISPLHYIPGKFPFWLYQIKTQRQDPSFKYYGLYKTTIRSVEKLVKPFFQILERRARVFDFLNPLLSIPIIREFFIHHVEFFLKKKKR